MRTGWLILALAGAAAGQAPAEKGLVERGYDHFYNLEYPEAIADFERAIAASPKDPELHNHLAQTLVFQEMYRNGALESELVSGTNSFLRRPKMNPDPETEGRFLAEIGRAMALAQARLNANPNDTAALYAMGISYGLRSNYYWVVKKSWRDSLRDATSARKLHNRVTELDPREVDARLVEGLHDYIIGSLPWTWRMLGFLVGMKGDKQQGIRIVEDVAQHGRDNRIDAEIFMGALYRRENQTRRAVPIVQNLIRLFHATIFCGWSYRKCTAWRAMNGCARSGRGGRAAQEPARSRIRPRALGEDLLSGRNGGILVPRPGPRTRPPAARGGESQRNRSEYRRVRVPADRADLRPNSPPARREAYRKAIAYAPEADAAQEARKYLDAPYRRS